MSVAECKLETWNVAECKLRKLKFKYLWWMRASYRSWEASHGRAGLAPRANLVIDSDANQYELYQSIVGIDPLPPAAAPC